ncbi:MAG: sugar ABC transporter permease [Spirochaetes bacterium]|nr:sugar ABC transporter permease [Spirochaetota bacterium]
MKKLMRFENILTAPTIVFLVILTIFPLLYTIGYSFTDYYYLSSSDKSFIGLENYQEIIRDDIFRKAVINTVKFMVLAVVIETTLGLFMALLIQGMKKGGKILRILFLLPMLLPPVTVALIWQMMLSNNRGIINQTLSVFHLGPFNWLLDVKLAMPSIIVIDVWQWTPFAFLLLYAALQTVPKNQYEAASIDGASSLAKFWYITVPNISQSIFIVILLRTIDTFRLFDKVNILTKGGPANSTTTITQYIYQKGVYNLKVGYGAAASMIMVIMVLIFSSFYIKQAFGAKKSQS